MTPPLLIYAQLSSYYLSPIISHTQWPYSHAAFYIFPSNSRGFFPFFSTQISLNLIPLVFSLWVLGKRSSVNGRGFSSVTLSGSYITLHKYPLVLSHWWVYLKNNNNNNWTKSQWFCFPTKCLAHTQCGSHKCPKNKNKKMSPVNSKKKNALFSLVSFSFYF